MNGYASFFDDISGKPERVIVPVKSGHVRLDMVSTLKGYMVRERAKAGLHITLNQATSTMRPSRHIHLGILSRPSIPGLTDTYNQGVARRHPSGVSPLCPRHRADAALQPPSPISPDVNGSTRHNSDSTNLILVRASCVM